MNNAREGGIASDLVPKMLNCAKKIVLVNIGAKKPDR